MNSQGRPTGTRMNSPRSSPTALKFSRSPLKCGSPSSDSRNSTAAPTSATGSPDLAHLDQQLLAGRALARDQLDEVAHGVEVVGGAGAPHLERHVLLDQLGLRARPVDRLLEAVRRDVDGEVRADVGAELEANARRAVRGRVEGGRRLRVRRRQHDVADPHREGSSCWSSATGANRSPCASKRSSTSAASNASRSLLSAPRARPTRPEWRPSAGHVLAASRRTPSSCARRSGSSRSAPCPCAAPCAAATRSASGAAPRGAAPARARAPCFRCRSRRRRRSAARRSGCPSSPRSWGSSRGRAGRERRAG